MCARDPVLLPDAARLDRRGLPAGRRESLGQSIEPDLRGRDRVDDGREVVDPARDVVRAGRGDAPAVRQPVREAAGLRQQTRRPIQQVFVVGGRAQPAHDAPERADLETEPGSERLAGAHHVGQDRVQVTQLAFRTGERRIDALAARAGVGGARVVVDAHPDRRALTHARRGASVSVHGVAVVALLVRAHGAVAAFAGTRGGAAVAVAGIAIVAGFRRRDDAVAARAHLAVRVTAVAGDLVAVVAFLVALAYAVAALLLAGGRAPVAAGGVAVVACLAARDDLVPAPGRRAVRVTAVAGDPVPVVARLTFLADTVAADVYLDALDVDEAILPARIRIRHREVARRNAARVEVEHRQVVARAPVEDLGLPGRDVARTDDERVVVPFADHLVASRPADQDVLVAAAVQLIVTRAAVEQVVAALGDQLVVAGSAEELVIEGPAAQAIAPVEAAQRVAPAVPRDVVSLVGPHQQLVAAGSGERDLERAGDLALCTIHESESEHCHAEQPDRRDHQFPPCCLTYFSPDGHRSTGNCCFTTHFWVLPRPYRTKVAGPSKASGGRA